MHRHGHNLVRALSTTGIEAALDGGGSAETARGILRVEGSRVDPS
jgi:hypothetical protein